MPNKAYSGFCSSKISSTIVLVCGAVRLCWVGAAGAGSAESVNGVGFRTVSSFLGPLLHSLLIEFQLMQLIHLFHPFGFDSSTFADMAIAWKCRKCYQRNIIQELWKNLFLFKLTTKTIKIIAATFIVYHFSWISHNDYRIEFYLAANI